MASYNSVTLVGNLTRDPEVRQAGQTSVCELGIAVSEKRKDATGQWKEETTFVDCTAWGRTADFAGEYLRKGACILVAGRLKMDQWEDRTSGQNRSKLKVVVDKLQALTPTDRRAGQSEPTEPAASGAGERYAPASGGDDIPF
jgi:single-strand DNA-binding protein